MWHSPAAVANYLSTFTRVAQLSARKMHPLQIAFLLGRSRSLIERYLQLIAQCEEDQNLKYHLDQMIELGQIGPNRSQKKQWMHRSIHVQL